MKLLPIGSAVRLSIVAVPIIALATPNAMTFNAANAAYMKALPACQAKPKVNQFGQKCMSWACRGWNPTLKCCYKWTCSPIG